MSYWRQGEPIADLTTDEGIPIRFTWQKRVHPIHDIANIWRVDDGWWHERVWRDYYKLITTTGLLVILAHDLITDEWRLIRIYD
jgi:hypothetical protein